jgi:hypothetical protein
VDDREAAIVADLIPGAYTAIVTGEKRSGRSGAGRNLYSALTVPPALAVVEGAVFR